MPTIEKDVNKGKGKKKLEKDIFRKNLVDKEILTTSILVLAELVPLGCC